AGRFADSSIQALINRSPASRSAAGDGSTDYARPRAPLGRSDGANWREFEIKDADPFDKHIPGAPCAQRASVARATPVLHSFRSEFGHAAALEPGRLRRGGKDFDEGRGPGSRRPRPCP